MTKLFYSLRKIYFLKRNKNLFYTKNYSEETRFDLHLQFSERLRWIVLGHGDEFIQQPVGNELRGDFEEQMIEFVAERLAYVNPLGRRFQQRFFEGLQYEVVDHLRLSLDRECGQVVVVAIEKFAVEVDLLGRESGSHCFSLLGVARCDVARENEASRNEAHHVDFILVHVQTKSFGERSEPSFGSTVDREARQRSQRAMTGHVDDSRLVLPDERQKLFRHPYRAGEVDVDLVRNHFRGLPFRLAKAHDTSVVDQSRQFLKEFM